LLFAGLVLFLMVTQKDKLEYALSNFSRVISLVTTNIQTQMDPPRKFVGNRMQKEDSLKMYVGEPFMSFGVRDWEEFWKIIYGVYSKENPEGPSFIPLCRQLDQEEMQQELSVKYPNPFSYFQDAQWEAFWKMIFSRQ
ncbi:MAG: hypothetical protein PHG51_05735, partial [Candidatus Omnitrophica bacterium]|nr:hypothetical protein [Candidatus Omnitrophota bacterium]